jgi:hypothetical protein
VVIGSVKTGLDIIDAFKTGSFVFASFVVFSFTLPLRTSGCVVWLSIGRAPVKTGSDMRITVLAALRRG